MVDIYHRQISDQMEEKFVKENRVKSYENYSKVRYPGFDVSLPEFFTKLNDQAKEREII